MASDTTPEGTVQTLQRRTASARLLFSEFADPDSGTIDRAGFAQLHKRILSDADAAATPSRVTTLGFANRFDEFDADGDGVLTWTEFVDVHNAMLAFELSANRKDTILSLADSPRPETGAAAEVLLSTSQPDGEASHPPINLPGGYIKKKQTRGSVIGDVGFAAAYKLTKSVERYDTVNISNNYVGRGVIQWIQRFDMNSQMRNLVAQNAQLKDADVRRLCRCLACHPHSQAPRHQR